MKEQDVESNHSILEKYFERGLWNTRFIVVIAVIFSALSSITLFLVGSFKIVKSLTHPFLKDSGSATAINLDVNEMLKLIIGAIDFYLIGVVLLMFSFGIYELFVSKIDIARKNLDVTILEVENIDQLKNKIIKVIIMVLIVSFFERILTMPYSTPQDMMYFAFSILALSLGVYMLNKKSH